MSRPFHVLLVATDRALLRQGAFMLQEFGVQVTNCADPPSAVQAIETGVIDFLIVDEQALAGQLERVTQWKKAAARHLHVLLLRSDISALDIDEAMLAGVDEFLRKPLSVGEVLTRLRAAARYAEFERRSNEQEWDDPVTGLGTHQALRDGLQGELKQGGRSRRLTLVVLELDFFQRWTYIHGTAHSQKLLRAVAETLVQNGVAGQRLARVADDRFAVLLPDHSPEKAAKHAERLRTLIGEIALPVEVHSGERLSASMGIAASEGDDDTPNAWLARATEALDDARRSGRDCIATYGQYDDDRRKWADEIKSGNPFASCIARDVMTPFSLELSATDTLALAAALLAHTHLELLPVLDSHSKFLGILNGERLREALAASARATQPVEQLVARDIPKLGEVTPFEQVIAHFMRDDQALLVVVAKDGSARGYIERERFLSLVKPLEADLFVAPEFSPGSEYLVVPDLIEVA
jgi:diguanylate cyclase (GGDEF)-like protein